MTSPGRFDLNPSAGRSGIMVSMVSTGLPELDIARARRWCAGTVPATYLDEMRVECDVTARHITILECRPSWSDGGGDEWFGFPIARMQYT